MENFLYRTIFWITVISLFSAACFAEADEKKKAKKQEPIHIVADQLETDNAKGTADFTGHVKVTQGDARILADKLRVVYDKGTEVKKGVPGKGDKGTIKKLIATGKVKINLEGYYAESDRAEYDTVTMILVLTGKNARVKQGDNYLTGCKIFLHRKEDRMSAKRCPGSQTTLVFYPEEEELEKKKQGDDSQ